MARNDPDGFVWEDDGPAEGQPEFYDVSTLACGHSPCLQCGQCHISSCSNATHTCHKTNHSSQIYKYMARRGRQRR